MNLFFASFLLLIPILLLLNKSSSSKRVPPGSLGVPIIGQSLSFLQALRSNTAEKWLEQRVRNYGPISKLSLFGKPTVFIYGQAANKFIFTNDGSTIANQQPQSFKMILGSRNLLDLNGQDHKRIRSALVKFLKPECLKQYVGKAEEEVKENIEIHWQGKQHVKVLPLMKTLTFNIICSLLFGLEEGNERDQFLASFQVMVEGLWSVPVNMPFTCYRHSLRESTRMQEMLKEIIHKKKTQLEQNEASPNQDLITCLLSMLDEDGKQLISEKEIIENSMFVMTAGRETSSSLITFIIRALANDSAVYEAVLQKPRQKFVAVVAEQEEIAKSKPSGESLTWEDLAKMKYTWRVAMETLRIFPPVFGGFRRTLTDIEYNGYLNPKGWQIFWVTAMTHMDNSLFQEPSKFEPNRFENQATFPPCCFIPFGAGTRICPGYDLARIETLVAIHYLVTRFTWELCGDNLFIRIPTLEPTEGLPIQIWPRTLS